MLDRRRDLTVPRSPPLIRHLGRDTTAEDVDEDVDDAAGWTLTAIKAKLFPMTFMTLHKH